MPHGSAAKCSSAALWRTGKEDTAPARLPVDGPCCSTDVWLVVGECIIAQCQSQRTCLTCLHMKGGSLAAEAGGTRSLAVLKDLAGRLVWHGRGPCCITWRTLPGVTGQLVVLQRLHRLSGHCVQLQGGGGGGSGVHVMHQVAQPCTLVVHVVQDLQQCNRACWQLHELWWCSWRLRCLATLSTCYPGVGRQAGAQRCVGAQGCGRHAVCAFPPEGGGGWIEL